MRLKIFNNEFDVSNILKLSLLTCIAGNLAQLGIGWSRGLAHRSDVLNSLKQGIYPNIRAFEAICKQQFTNIQTSLNNGTFETEGYTFSAILYSSVGDFFILVVMFLFFGSLLVKYRDIFFRTSLNSFVIVYLILLCSDQIRYIFTSIISSDKKLYTWSSYCFHGEAGWLADIIGYMALYVPVALTITAMLILLYSFNNIKLDIKKSGFGIQRELEVVEGSFKWLRITAIVFFYIWTTTNDSSSESSILYAAQAILIFIFIAIIYIWSLLVFHNVDTWYNSEKEKLRLEISISQEKPLEEVLDEDLKRAGLQDNIYLRHVGKHRIIAFANLGAILLPGIGFINTWIPLLEDMPKIFK